MQALSTKKDLASAKTKLTSAFFVVCWHKQISTGGWFQIQPDQLMDLQTLWYLVLGKWYLDLQNHALSKIQVL